MSERHRARDPRDVVVRRNQGPGSQKGSQGARWRPTSADAFRRKLQARLLTTTPIDTQSPTTDQKVGGLNPSERTKKAQVRCLFGRVGHGSGMRVAAVVQPEGAVSRTRTVVDLEAERTRRLSASIERGLRRGGGRGLAVDEDRIDDVGRWRRAAVMAAHRLGHRASTYRWRGQWDVALDVPVSAVEQRSAAELTVGLIFAKPRAAYRGPGSS